MTSPTAVNEATSRASTRHRAPVGAPPGAISMPTSQEESRPKPRSPHMPSVPLPCRSDASREGARQRARMAGHAESGALRTPSRLAPLPQVRWHGAEVVRGATRGAAPCSPPGAISMPTSQEESRPKPRSPHVPSVPLPCRSDASREGARQRARTAENTKTGPLRTPSRLAPLLQERWRGAEEVGGATRGAAAYPPPAHEAHPC
jgi:hypothetical protein